MTATDCRAEPAVLIETDRLSMRPMWQPDQKFYCDLYGDPKAMHFVGPPLSRERAERSFRIVLASRGRDPIVRLFLAIVGKANRHLIGIGGFQGFDSRRRRVEVGMILTPESQGQGFGKEGLSGLVTYAFSAFAVDEVWIQHAAENEVARRVPDRLGFADTTDSATSKHRPGQIAWSAFRQSWPPGRP